jgi:hypothetical protein
MDSVILAGNTGPDGNLRVQDDSGSTVTLTASFSLFGDAPGEFDSSSDMVFDDMPDVLPLADNDCFRPAGAPGFELCVPTHRIADTSPALDAGSNPQSFAFDQRGSGFRRRSGPSADIGAIEIDPDLLFKNGFEP